MQHCGGRFARQEDGYSYRTPDMRDVTTVVKLF